MMLWAEVTEAVCPMATLLVAVAPGVRPSRGRRRGAMRGGISGDRDGMRRQST